MVHRRLRANVADAPTHGVAKALKLHLRTVHCSHTLRCGYPRAIEFAAPQLCPHKTAKIVRA